MTTHTTSNEVRTIFNEHGLELRLLDIETIPSEDRFESYYLFIADGETTNGTNFHITFGFHDYELEGQRELAMWKSRISDYINFWGCPFSEGIESNPDYASSDRAEITEIYSAIYDDLARIAA